MSTHDDEHGSSASSQYGQPQQQYGRPPVPGQPYGQPQPDYGQQYGQHGQAQQPYGQQYGEAQQPYGQQYGEAQQPYGQQYQPAPYGHAQGQPYGQQTGYPPQYGQYGQYGQSAVPAKPGGVITAAVLGFVFGAIGVIFSLLFIFAGAVFGGASGDSEIPGLGEFTGAAAGIAFALGLLALAWTVVMIWGAVWALNGRSRVMLIVGGSIAIAFTGLYFIAALSSGDGGGIIFTLLLFAAAIAIVVLLAMKPAAAFFAAHRARRGR